MNNKPKFGQFISEKRQKLSMESQELAKALGISNAYLSQLEKGIRTHPSAELLDKMAKILYLNKAEKETMYDLYAEASGQVSPDIAEYVAENKIVRQAIRAARDANAADEDWKQFIEQLKK